MGGHAFQDSLYCPRLSTKLYEALKEHCTQLLLKQFDHVVIPPKAPEKVDHGDLDVIVCGPRDSLATSHRINQMQDPIKENIGATAARCSNGVLFLAVQIPETLLYPGCFSNQTLSETAQEVEDGSESNTTPPFVQIDIQLCSTPSQLPWSAFWTSYGDLSDILKIGLRPAGFSIRLDGFYLRNPIIEPLAYEQCFVYLTNDLAPVLSFLGLDPSKYAQGFSTLDESFTYAMSARFMSRRDFFDDSRKETNGRSARDFGLYKRTRAEWSSFIDAWLPSHPSTGSAPLPPRDEIIDTALRFFGAQGRYHSQERTFLLGIAEAEFWVKVRNMIPGFFPEGEKIGQGRKQRIISALHRWVGFASFDGYAKRPIVLEKPELEPEKYAVWIGESERGGFQEGELTAWIEAHWKEIYELERARTRPARHEKVAKKESEKLAKLEEGAEKPLEEGIHGTTDGGNTVPMEVEMG